MLSLVILAVPDVTRALAFYQSAFGWPLEVDAPPYKELRLPGGMRLGLYERHGFGRNTGQVPAAVGQGELSPTELYLHFSDLDAAIARVEAAGARRLSAAAAREWGEEVAYYADPDGVVLALARAR